MSDSLVEPESPFTSEVRTAVRGFLVFAFSACAGWFILNGSPRPGLLHPVPASLHRYAYYVVSAFIVAYVPARLLAPTLFSSYARSPSLGVLVSLSFAGLILAVLNQWTSVLSFLGPFVRYLP